MAFWKESNDRCSASLSPDDLNVALDLSNFHARSSRSGVLSADGLIELTAELVELATDERLRGRDVGRLAAFDLDEGSDSTGEAPAFGTGEMDDDIDFFVGARTFFCGYFTCPVGS